MGTTVVRVNISIATDLKARMDAIGRDTNWSRVAAEAFELELVRLASRTEEAKTMKDVLSRLKKAGEIENRETLEAADERGRWWAMNRASPRQLLRLEAYVEAGRRGGGPFVGQPMAPWGHSAYLAFAVYGCSPDQEAVERFWVEDVRLDTELMAELDDTEFLEAFVDAALVVWDEVKDQL